jgi:hypothetical protein
MRIAVIRIEAFEVGERSLAGIITGIIRKADSHGDRHDFWLGECNITGRTAP